MKSIISKGWQKHIFDGFSLNNPLGWTDVVSDDNTYSTSNSSSNLWNYFVIKLVAGTKYTITQTERSFDTAFWFYDTNKSIITSVDSDSPSSPNSSGKIDGDSFDETFYYTPTVSGIYYLCWGAYSSGTGTATIKITPKPEIYSTSISFIESMQGLDINGFPKIYNNTDEAGIKYDPIT